ncbi:unnamed protein product, partial [Ectocarpus sp. 13 AM-2016]
ILHVLLLLATGATEAQRRALVTSGFHVKLLELFKTTMEELRRARRADMKGESGDGGGGSPPPPPAADWPEYMTPCLLLLDLVAKPSSTSQATDLGPQV